MMPQLLTNYPNDGFVSPRGTTLCSLKKYFLLEDFKTIGKEEPIP
jgi:hypothetical protein